MLQIFITFKSLLSSVGSEPANLGLNCKHDSHTECDSQSNHNLFYFGVLSGRHLFNKAGSLEELKDRTRKRVHSATASLQ